MAEINASPTVRHRPGIHQKKQNPKTDMTPMVDLGFLLISFFVITTELSRPMVTHLNMPKDGPPITLGMSDALTVLLGKDNSIFYYHGEWKDAFQSNEIVKTNFTINGGIGDIIRQKQKWLDQHNRREGRKGLMLLIKPGPEANYANVVDMIDQALINKVEKYAVLKTETDELSMLTLKGF